MHQIRLTRIDFILNVVILKFLIYYTLYQNFLTT